MVTAIQNHGQVNLANNDEEQYYQNGMNNCNQGNFIAAWNCFNEAIKINPRNDVYYIMRSDCASESEDPNVCRVFLKEIEKQLSVTHDQVNLSWMHLDMAMLYSELDDDENAMDHTVAAARLGHPFAIAICKQYGIPY